MNPRWNEYEVSFCLPNKFLTQLEQKFKRQLFDEFVFYNADDKTKCYHILWDYVENRKRIFQQNR